jgi:hypothetical protein
MELMEVYQEAVAKWIIARATSGKCEGSEFVFDLIESAIRKEATEILLTPVQESDMVRVDFGRLHCYYRQPKITPAQFAYLAIYLGSSPDHSEDDEVRRRHCHTRCGHSSRPIT